MLYIYIYIYINVVFFNSVNLSFAWALSIQFSSYFFLINNDMLFELVFNF